MDVADQPEKQTTNEAEQTEAQPTEAKPVVD